MGRRILLGLAAGLLAGPLVGLGEALYILTSGHPSEYVALFYAAVLYAFIGLGLGLFTGIGTALLGLAWKKLSPALAYTLSFLGVFCALGAVITRYIVNKVVFLERGVSMQGNLAILGVFGAIFLLGLWLGPILLTRTPFKVLLRAKGTLALYGLLALLAGIFSLSPAAGGDPDGVLAPEREQSPELADKPDLILIMVDTLRADHVDVYGETQGLTPSLDALARDGVVFEQAIAQASWTRPCTANLFTSMLPSRHTCDVKVAMLPDEVETLAEVLRDRGLITGGLPNNINVTRSFNFQQGFDYFAYQAPAYLFGATETASQLSMYNVLRKLRDRIEGDSKRVEDYYQPAEVVFEAARTFIEANRGKRWFLFVHLMEPHDPYFEHPLNGKGYARAEHEHPDPKLKDYLKQTYAGEVKYVDQRIGEFLEYLKRQGIYDEALIVVTADHGEEFYEHGGWWHGTTLYDEQIRVPLIVKLPHQRYAGTRVPWQVRQIDVPATLVQAVGAPLPESWQGRELFDPQFESNLALGRAPAEEGDARAEASADTEEAADSGETAEAEAAPREPLPWWEHPASRTALSEENFEGNVLEGIRDGGWKLVQANADNPRGLEEMELYDLRTDPGETQNHAGQAPDEQARLAAALEKGLAESRSHAASQVQTEIDEATEDRLRALGYME